MEAAKDEILYAGAVRYFKMELTWVTAWNDFIAFAGRGSFISYM
jgi:hypothetical protein